MQEEKGIAKKLKGASEEQTHRIVIDEIFPDGLMRILSSKRVPGVEESRSLEMAAWQEEEEHYLTTEQLTSQFEGLKASDVREGQVLILERGHTRSVRDDVRGHMKEKAKRLLDREGRTQGAEEGR